MFQETISIIRIKVAIIRFTKKKKKITDCTNTQATVKQTSENDASLIAVMQLCALQNCCVHIISITCKRNDFVCLNSIGWDYWNCLTNRQTTHTCNTYQWRECVFFSFICCTDVGKHKKCGKIHILTAKRTRQSVEMSFQKRQQQQQKTHTQHLTMNLWVIWCVYFVLFAKYSRQICEITIDILTVKNKMCCRHLKMATKNSNKQTNIKNNSICFRTIHNCIWLIWISYQYNDSGKPYWRTRTRPLNRVDRISSDTNCQNSLNEWMKHTMQCHAICWIVNVHFHSHWIEKNKKQKTKTNLPFAIAWNAMTD